MNARVNPASSARRRESIVACAVGDEQYVLRGVDVCEIVRAERMRKVGRPDGTVGTLDVAGEIVPVFALAEVLQRPFRPAGHHVVVTRGPVGTVGWLVDRIVRSTLPEGVHPMPLPPGIGTVASRWFQGLLRIDDRPLLVLSAENLDPRASALSARAARAAAPASTPAGRMAQEDGNAPLVVLFSSPALPACEVPHYALSARRIAAVTRSLPMTVVPGSAPHIAGIMTWRDAAVPVVDVRAEAMRRAAAPQERYIVAQCGAAANGALVAFAVGDDVTLHQPTRGDRLVDDAPAPPPFVSGIFSVSGRRVALLDLDVVLPSLASAAGDGLSDARPWA